jgi:CRISPR-associated protein Csd1
MILQALKEYYDRKADDPESGIAPEGWEPKEIHVLIRIDKEGNFISIESMVDENFKAKKFLVPQGRYRSGQKAYAMPYLFWDHYGFVLGYPKSETAEDRELAEKQRMHFANRILEYAQKHPEISAALAVDNFYKGKKYLDVIDNSNWQEFIRKAPPNKTVNLTFAFANELRLIAETLELDDTIMASGKNKHGVCLISGENAVLAELHSAIGGVTQKPAPLVAINDKTGSTSFSSYGKTQCYNSPISKTSVFKYTTALNYLLDPNKIPPLRVGDMRIAYWSDDDSWLERDFSFLFQESDTVPDIGARAIKGLYDSVKNGAYVASEGQRRFYVLGMAPNSGRIAIKSWHNKTIAEIACNIQRHFEDIEIIRPGYEKLLHYPLWRLLCNVAPQGESKNVPSNLASDLFATILEGLPYPSSLMQAAIRRTHAGIKRKTKNSETTERVIPEIAALIKAYLNRFHRININPNHKEIFMSLDETNPSPGYQFGRLFAVLEKCQRDALGKDINSTIVDRYYSSASSTPAVVFPILMRMNQHHLAKIDNQAIKVFDRNHIESIMCKIGDFKPHLDLHEQGRFAIGYYHQRQDFLPKKTIL